MLRQKIDKEGLLESSEYKVNEKEMGLADIFCKIVNIRKTVYKAAVVGGIIGLIFALSIPKQYTVTVTLSPEMGSSKGSNGLAGLAASFLGSSANVGEGVDALNASLSSDIISSTPFLLELLSTNIGEGKNATLQTYLDNQSLPWWKYVIGLPGTIIGGIKSLFETEIKATDTSKGQRTIELTRDEANNIHSLRKVITASVNNKTAITNISVTLQDPVITAIIADSVICKLQKYITNYRTSKAKDDCAYLEKLFKERQQEYYIAQKKYANYMDAHDNLILHSVRTEQERLQNDMNLAYQVYSQVANQLQVARAKVQEEKPVFAVVEPSVVPLEKSNIGMKIIIIFFVFLSVLYVLCWELLVKEVWYRLKKILKE